MTRNLSLSGPELIVLGGGCAGLSLAARLLEQRPDMPLLVVEPRTAHQEDRTWCGWRLAPHFFQDCAVAEWNEWRILGRGVAPLLRHSSYPYKMIRASHFYDKACRVIERSSNATLLMGAEAGLVFEAADHVLVHLADGMLRMYSGLLFSPALVSHASLRTIAKRTKVWWMCSANRGVLTDFE